MAHRKATPTEPAPSAPITGLDERERNPYYDRVAGRYRAAKYLTLVLLVLTLLAGLITGSGSITYANFVYLLRDFDTILDSSGETVSSIRYGASDERQYLLFREGLSLVGRDGVEVYNTAGRRTLEDELDYTLPRGAASSQYLLVWDMGGKSFSLYNSLSSIYSETLDYPIVGGAISDAGLFAVVTRTREYTSAVLLYGKNCRLKNRYLKDKYVMDVAISSDGKRVAVASVESSDGAYLCELQLLEPGKDSALATLSLAGEFPLAVRFFSDNSCALLGSTALYFYDSEGNSTGIYRFDEDAPSRLSVEEDTAALAFPGNVVGSASRLLLLDARGEVIAEQTIDGKTIDLAQSGGSVWLLTENRLWRWNAEKGETTSAAYDGGGKALLGLATDEGAVLLCTGRAAYRYSPGDLKT